MTIKPMLLNNRILYFPRPSRLVEYAKSFLRPIDLDPAVVETVLSSYALEMTRPPANLPLSRRTRNIIVTTPGGKKVLKRYKRRLQIPNIRYSHSILSRLDEQGFPGPRLVAAPDGENIIHYDGENYALFDYIEGINYSLNFLLRTHRLRLMVLASQTLARLHRQLGGFLPDGQHYLGFASYTGPWQRDTDWFKAKIESLKQKSIQLRGDAEKMQAGWLIQHSGYIFDEFCQLDERLAAANLPRQIIHGDYGLHNLVFQKDGTVTPIDFESARLEWRLSDLTSCLSKLQYASGAYDFESLHIFMTAYQEVFPISAGEWQFLPAVWRFHKLRAAIIYWNSYFESNGPLRKLLSARDALAQADWTLEHPDMLLAINPDVSRGNA
jgi:Ser/Thr protein kinase RdoA (MazF antagonist)